MASSLWPLQVFDPNAEFSIVERKLPHWSQAGTVCFITWRTIDSIPKSVLNRWHADREEWLRRHGIDSRGWHSLLQAVCEALEIRSSCSIAIEGWSWNPR